MVASCGGIYLSKDEILCQKTKRYHNSSLVLVSLKNYISVSSFFRLVSLRKYNCLSSQACLGHQNIIWFIWIFKEPDQSTSCAILNWRTASYGNPALDISLLAMASLPPQTWRSAPCTPPPCPCVGTGHPRHVLPDCNLSCTAGYADRVSTTITTHSYRHTPPSQ